MISSPSQTTSSALSLYDSRVTAQIRLLLEQRNRTRQERQKYSESLSAYAASAWPLLEPVTPLVTGRYFDCLCEYLTSVTTGQIRRLIINIMPRVGKSSLIAVLWPTWEWARDGATSRWMFASYADDLSIRDSVRRRQVIQSAWYQRYWGEAVRLSRDVNLKDEYVSTQSGAMFSTWIGGGTGRGGKRLVIDDPHSPKKALSDSERETAVSYIRNVLISRLDNPATDSIVMVMQRLHENDAAGEFLSSGGWTHLDLQAEAEERTVITMPVSGEEWTREKDDLLEPERFPKEVLEGIRREMGTPAYSAQYQQRPAPKGGILFQSAWWQFYKTAPAFDLLVLSVDCAFKDFKTSDYVALQVIGFTGPKVYVVDKRTEHLGYSATKAAIRSLRAQYPQIAHVLIEDAANGPAVIEELSREFPGIIAVRPEGGKTARAQAATADVEAGNVYLPEDAEWTLGWLTLFSKFPLVKHDDDVDSFSQALNWQRRRLIPRVLV
jgi:predicted phage terminase large subunit-like protein